MCFFVEGGGGGENIENEWLNVKLLFSLLALSPPSCPSMTTSTGPPGLLAGLLVALDQEGVRNYLRCVLLFVKMQRCSGDRCGGSKSLTNMLHYYTLLQCESRAEGDVIKPL